MFFRREKTRQRTFDDHVEALRTFGFSIQPEATGRVRAVHRGCAAVVEDTGGATPTIHRAGFLVGNEIAHLVNAGYQQFFLTPSGKRKPALATELRALHDCQEDMKEALGLTSLYNEGLGTVSNRHMYDRVEDRDAGVPDEPWRLPPRSGVNPEPVTNSPHPAPPETRTPPFSDK